jgi:hypothetical protein
MAARSSAVNPLVAAFLLADFCVPFFVEPVMVTSW